MLTHFRSIHLSEEENHISNSTIRLEWQPHSACRFFQIRRTRPHAQTRIFASFLVPFFTAAPATFILTGQFPARNRRRRSGSPGGSLQRLLPVRQRHLAGEEYDPRVDGSLEQALGGRRVVERRTERNSRDRRRRQERPPGQQRATHRRLLRGLHG